MAIGIYTTHLLVLRNGRVWWAMVSAGTSTGTLVSRNHSAMHEGLWQLPGSRRLHRRQQVRHGLLDPSVPCGMHAIGRLQLQFHRSQRRYVVSVDQQRRSQFVAPVVLVRQRSDVGLGRVRGIVQLRPVMRHQRQRQRLRLRLSTTASRARFRTGSTSFGSVTRELAKNRHAHPEWPQTRDSARAAP